jgi:hypothetical protein
LAGFDQPCQVNRQLNQVVFIQRAHRVVNEYVFQLIESIVERFSAFCNIQLGNQLLKQGIENAPDKIALLAFGDFYVRLWLFVAALK